MGIAAAFSNATSGLAAIARGTETVSGNIANAATPGYGRRELVLAGTTEGGVRVASVARVVSASVVADMRIADAAASYGRTISSFHAGLETAIGAAGSGDALADRVAALETALLAAAARPDSDIRLSAVADAARGLASATADAAASIAEARSAADRGIADDVARLKSGLTEVARLNRAIITDQANGRDTGSLVDDRQRIIDDLATIVPIREVPRDAGRVALFTTGGAALLDGTDPIDLSFAAAGQMTPQMQVGTAPVSRLVMDGHIVGDDLMSLFAGGALQARFAVRDRLGPQAQANLDAFARDLVERFADPALDPTLAAGAAGLFADRTTTTATALVEQGLSNRLAVNASLVADGSGDHLLRDGFGAALLGEVGRASLLTAMAGRLMATRVTASTAIPHSMRTAAGFAADLSAKASTGRVEAEAALGRSTAHAEALRVDLLADGVDTDAEMTRLLQLEQAYAANARVIRAADEMLSRILEI